jgi:peroxiredoxin
LRSFQKRLPDFDARALRVAAISVDAPESAHGNCRRLGITYSFLSDANAEVTRRYGLLHPGGGPNGADIARPAELLIDSGGVIRWVNLTESVIVRARPEQVLKAFDDLNPAEAAGR